MMIYLQKVVIDQNGRSQSSTEKAKIRCGMTDQTDIPHLFGDLFSTEMATRLPMMPFLSDVMELVRKILESQRSCPHPPVPNVKIHSTEQ